MQCIHNNNKNAFVLSIVLWIVAAILVGVTAIAMFSKDSVSLSTKLNYKLQARLSAQSVLEALKFYIATANYDNNSLINANFTNFTYKLPKKIVLDGRSYMLDKNITIKLQDTSSLVNVLTSSCDTIAFLATTPTQRALRHTISGSIADWRDTDNMTRLNGAENPTYEFKKKVTYKARNSDAIQDSQELRLINGIDTIPQVQWQNLRKMLYYGRTGVINLALINSYYLSFLLQIDNSYAKTLIDIRSEDMNKFIKIVSALPKFNDGYMGFYISKQFKIEIVVNKSGARSILKTLIDFHPTKQYEWTTESYNIQ